MPSMNTAIAPTVASVGSVHHARSFCQKPARSGTAVPLIFDTGAAARTGSATDAAAAACAAAHHPGAQVRGRCLVENRARQHPRVTQRRGLAAAALAAAQMCLERGARIRRQLPVQEVDHLLVDLFRSSSPSASYPDHRRLGGTRAPRGWLAKVDQRIAQLAQSVAHAALDRGLRRADHRRYLGERQSPSPLASGTLHVARPAAARSPRRCAPPPADPTPVARRRSAARGSDRAASPWRRDRPTAADHPATRPAGAPRAAIDRCTGCARWRRPRSENFAVRFQSAALFTTRRNTSCQQILRRRGIPREATEEVPHPAFRGGRRAARTPRTSPA